MYTSCMKNVMYLVTKAKLSLDKHYFLPLFTNVIKNKITSLVIYIIVCLSEIG